MFALSGRGQTTDAALEVRVKEAFEATFKLACECRTLAYSDPAAAADRLGREGARIMARAGLTKEEGWRYLDRISEMVFMQG